jgi:hypothetical protein
MDMCFSYAHQRTWSARRLGAIHVANLKKYNATLKIHVGRGAPRSWIHTPIRKITNPIRMIALAV